MQVMAITLSNEVKCEEFKSQFSKFDYLWKKDLQTALQEFLAAEVRGRCHSFMDKYT